MKTAIILAALCGALTVVSCQQNGSQSEVGSAVAEKGILAGNIEECNVRIGNVSFTHALNGADTCVAIKDDGVLEFRCTEKRDIFCDPNGKLSNNTIPILLSSIDNTKPFTLTAKVSPGFTKEGLYNAADLFIYANDTTWQKLCFEQDERGNHRIVTVRTLGTSDDNNHQQLDVPAVYLRLSSDTHTIVSYYSLDKEEWQMVRLYENYYPAKVWIGIASQSPTAGICVSTFEDVTLEQTSVGDLRTGN